MPFLRRALDEALTSEDRVEVLLELGDAERAAGKLPDVAERLREAVRLADAPIVRARALVELGRTIGPDPAAHRELLALLEATLTRASALELDRDLELRLKGALLTAAFTAGSREKARVSEIAAEFAQLPGDTPSESIALCGLIESVVQRGLLAPNSAFNAAEIGSLAERAAHHADELLAAGVRDSRAHGLLLTLRWTDHLDAAERVTEQWTEIARRQGSEEAFAAARMHSSHLNRARGRLRQAEADAEATAAAPPGSVSFVMASVALTDCLITKGDLGAAQAAYDAIGCGEQIPPFPPYGAVLGIRLELRGALGRHAAVLADYAELTRRFGPSRRSGAPTSAQLCAASAAAPPRASRCVPGMSLRASAVPTASLKPPASSLPPAGSGSAANGSAVPSPSPRASDESPSSRPRDPATPRSRKRCSSPSRLSRCTSHTPAASSTSPSAPSYPERSRIPPLSPPDRQMPASLCSGQLGLDQ